MTRFLAFLVSTLLVFALFHQTISSPVPQNYPPNHAGPGQFGSEHLGPARKNQHAGPPSEQWSDTNHGHGHHSNHGHGHGTGSSGPVDISLYGQ